ncbi:hypothetical protein EI94DRAFT_1802979 [Lactarius quietus]|nr:hypothetical protein EI94DRAFT_1802979 [Lactarius quietus]
MISLLSSGKEEVIATNPPGQPIVKVVEWLSRTTLGIIGEAGFGFQFGSLDRLENPLREQFGNLFVLPPRYDIIIKTLWYYLPERLLDFSIRYLPTSRYRWFRRYSAFMRNLSQGIVKRSIIEGDGTDVMSVLLRANASKDPRSKLSDSELTPQIANVEQSAGGDLLLIVDSTLLLAGHDNREHLDMVSL